MRTGGTKIIFLDNRMSDVKTEYPTLHNMTDKHALLYEIFCKSRTELRAAGNADDELRRQEFIEAGLRAAEVANGQHQVPLLTEHSK